jgi:hypothetical protein
VASPTRGYQRTKEPNGLPAFEEPASARQRQYEALRAYFLDQVPTTEVARRFGYLADAVRFFHIDALSSSVGLKVDFDMVLLVLASGLYRLIGRRMRGYQDAQARQIFRDLIDMPADVAVTESEVTVRFHRRAHLPIILASGLLNTSTEVPWWNNRILRFVA